MKAIITINILNQETLFIFKHRLKNGSNFLERVFIKISVLIKESLKDNAYALISLHQLHDEMLSLYSYFDDEKDNYEGQLENYKGLRKQKVDFIASYSQSLPLSNIFSSMLVDLIEIFDALICSLKLSLMNGLIENRRIFYLSKQQYQKKLNSFLSKILTASFQKNQNLTVREAIESNKSLNLETLKAALDTPYSPQFPPRILEQIKNKIEQSLNRNT